MAHTPSCRQPSRRQVLLQTAGAWLVASSPAAALGDAGTGGARDVLTRLIGRRADAFRLKLTPAADDSPWYQVTSRGGQVTIEGSSPVALSRGAYAYLKDTGLAALSWEGARADLPKTLPAFDGGRVASPFQHRAYMNTCTFGYTTPWWNWARWQREIDWMALHGIDMPLAMEGQEYVWRALWRASGLSDTELADYFSGPAFTPWQRMGNIEGYDAPLPAAWIDKKRDLQVRILGRMRSLGMKPILPAFAGYVPRAFADKHPEARIYKMRAWEGFNATYWLDPADPLFANIAGQFIALYDATYGAGDYYLADAFNEMLPPIAADGADAAKASYGDATANKAAVEAVAPEVKAERLAAYGRAIYDSLRQARPGAVWVMQGWLFGADQKFWTPDAIGAFLSQVPDDKMLVLDIGNDRYPDVWKNAHAFQGKGWIYGYVHNYGGSNPIYGDLDFYRSDMAAIAASPQKGQLKGFGVFPEGLHSNSVVYEYLYDLAWGEGGDSTEGWLQTYSRARYGLTSPDLLSAWQDLNAAVYRTKYWTPRWWHSTAGAYLLFKRPDIAMADYDPAPGDRGLLKQAVLKLLALPAAYGRSPLFRNDLIDAARHLVSLEIDDRVQAAIKAYQAGDLNAGDRAVAEINNLVTRLDLLLGEQQECLASWIDDAKAYGDTPADRAYYARNARAQVTVWGGAGNLHDYASKAWQGLYRDFYLPRWTQFLGGLRQAAVAKTSFDQARFTADITTWEHAWVDSDAAHVRRRPKHPIASVRGLMASLEQS